MNPALAGLTCVVIAGAVTAVAAREPRVALLGLLVVLLGAAFLADPLPSPLAMSGRIVAAVLAARLIAIAIRGGDERTAGSRLGWPVEALAAAAAAVVGYGTHGLGAPGGGPPEAQAAGFAIGVLAAAPIVSGRDVFRLGTGSILLLTAGLLVRQAIGGTPSELEELATSGLVVGLGGAVAALTLGARAAAGGLAPEPPAGSPRRPTRIHGRLPGGAGPAARSGAHRLSPEAGPGPAIDPGPPS